MGEADFGSIRNNIRDTTNIMASVFNIEDVTYNQNELTLFENDVIVFDSSNTRFGIGTANPSQALDVSGNIYATLDISAGNNITANSMTVLSDLSVVNTIYTNDLSAINNIYCNNLLANKVETSILSLDSEYVSQILLVGKNITANSMNVLTNLGVVNTIYTNDLSANRVDTSILSLDSGYLQTYINIRLTNSTYYFFNKIKLKIPLLDSECTVISFKADLLLASSIKNKISLTQCAETLIDVCANENIDSTYIFLTNTVNSSYNYKIIPSNSTWSENFIKLGLIIDTSNNSGRSFLNVQIIGQSSIPHSANSCNLSGPLTIISSNNNEKITTMLDPSYGNFISYSDNYPPQGIYPPNLDNYPP